MASGTPFLSAQVRKSVRVRPEEAGERLDRFLAAALLREHGLEPSSRALRRAIEAGAVWVDGHRVRVSSRSVRAGSRVELVLASDGLAEPNPPPDLEGRILYEDRDLIAIDKPSGLPTQATPDDATGHAFEAVRRYLERRVEGSSRRSSRSHGEIYVALHHRLDRGTSGILLLAKARRANAGLAAAFREGRVEKTYRALCGDPSGRAELPGLGESESVSEVGSAGRVGEIELPLVRDGRKMRAIFDGEAVPSKAQTAATRFRIDRIWSGAQGSDGDGVSSNGMDERGWPRAFALDAHPSTGRRHQIRAHFAALGIPVLGDRLYGPARGDSAPPPVWPARPMLHASRLELEHPVTGEPLRIDCPLPEDFEATVRALDAHYGRPRP